MQIHVNTPIALAADHAGVELKSALIHMLELEGYPVTNLGTNSSDSVDYPDYAHALAEWLHKQPETARGILICGSGIGISIAANRHAHIRAALCMNAEMATLARQHNNANVLCLGARFTGEALAKTCTQTFLTTRFEGGRHDNRVKKLTRT